jgi:hypothetical protein
MPAGGPIGFVMVQVGVVTTRIQGWVHAVHAIGDQ